MRVLKVRSFTKLAILSFFVLALLLCKAALLLLVWAVPDQGSVFHALGAFGIYPTHRFVTLPRNVTVPKGQWIQWDKSCDDGGLILLAPFGVAVDRPGPVILNARGELVWASTDRFFDTTTNLNVQTYNGTPYLTFWAGNKHGGEGSGVAYMLDANYEVYKEFRATGLGLRTDLHEFSITPDGHALFSTINDTKGDLTALGWFRGANGPIEDSIAQEFDIATGELVFQWRASDHFQPAESFFWNPFGGYNMLQPFDFFHLNAIQKDTEGNYLISSRHFHEILYVDGRNRDILWTLGGNNGRNAFTDLSNGKATDFTWQHHAQWQPQGDGIITVMDNAGAGYLTLHQKATSSALMLQLDQANRTVELLRSYTIDRLSHSQCSMQVLPSRHVFVGWGPVAASTEHDIAGDLLCEFNFAARWWFGLEWVKNYRTFKVYNWHSTPKHPPVAKIKDKRVYVSWNGATEVQFWRLEGAKNLGANEVYHNIDTIAKEGFESFFDIPRDFYWPHVRVAALDISKNLLGVSKPADVAAKKENRGTDSVLVFSCLLVVSVILSGTIVHRLWMIWIQRR